MSDTFDWNQYKEVSPDKKDDSFDWNQYKEVSTETPEVSQLESGIRGAAQGLTFGFADEITAAAEAAFKAATSPEDKRSILDMYRQARDESRKNYEATREANPMTYTAGEIAGGIAPALATGGAGAITSLGKVGLGQAIKQGAIAGAGYGAVQGLGATEADLTKGEVGQAGLDIGKGTLLGGAVGGAIPLAGAGIKAGGQKAIELTSDALSSARNTNPVIDKILKIRERAAEGSLKTGQKELVEQGMELESTTQELPSILKSLQNKVYTPIKEIEERMAQGKDVTEEILALEKRIADGEFATVSNEAKQEIANIVAEGRKRISENRVVKTGEQQAIEKAETMKAKILRDAEEKQKLLDEQNLQGKEVEKAAQKAELKRLSRIEDIQTQNKTLGEPEIPVMGEVKEIPSTQRQVFTDMRTGKNVSTPIKQISPKELPRFTETISEPEFNRVVFRDRKTGDTIEIPYVEKDITEDVLKRGEMSPKELSGAAKEMGEIGRSTNNAVSEKVANEYRNVYKRAIEENLIKSDIPEYQALNKQYAQLIRAFDVMEPAIRNFKGADKERSLQALSAAFQGLGDVRNLPIQVRMKKFFDSVESIDPELIKPYREKIMKLADDIEINQMVLGIDPTMSGQFSRLLGGAISWAARGAEFVGKQQYKYAHPSSSISKLSPNKYIQKLAYKTSDELQQKAQQYRLQGNESVANFLDNLGQVTSDSKKKALLYTASQNPNLKGFIKQEEEETP